MPIVALILLLTVCVACISMLAVYLNFGVGAVLLLVLGVGIGAAGGVVAAITAFKRITENQTGKLESIFRQLTSEIISYNGHDSLVIEILGRILKLLVRFDTCACCGTDRDSDVNPFSSKYHTRACPVPLGFHLYKTYKNNSRISEKERADIKYTTRPHKTYRVVGKNVKALLTSRSTKNTDV